tara:strand:- start:778 stop:1212 length:435 start_codon:yes stop_codon:yes gene_type:complete
MNIDNVNKAISVMERVKERGDRIDMHSWQDGATEIALTEQDLHTCGTAACFAGWVAVSPEFTQDGGKAKVTSGMPVLKNEEGVRAIALWLGMTYFEALGLCGLDNWRDIYGANMRYEDIDADAILTALYRLRDTGFIFPVQPDD